MLYLLFKIFLLVFGPDPEHCTTSSYSTSAGSFGSVYILDVSLEACIFKKKQKHNNPTT